MTRWQEDDAPSAVGQWAGWVALAALAAFAARTAWRVLR